ncbi:mpv17-like protein isoform X2 [Eurytemora carolleeae]|uniref:mpv17-like protein isoform X2 n=1 Tax=Eurytemora carolleeae TaxID=1294199 RepID=UPI000C788F72|nr:mpv17-like protein isoform X2 [Eurytemora carolleeae]|eukprot:XP_023328780.1 mpv17-like protein isoform X2 [Eurytemora affinis]
MSSQLFAVFRRYPVVPSMLTYSVLYPGANLVQQKYIRNKNPEDKIDWNEASRFLIYGGLMHAPLVYNWLRLASRLFPKNNLTHLFAKVAMDQTCFAPVGLSSFYIGLSALEGKDFNGIYEEWNAKFLDTWAASVFIWPFLQTINFKLVPAHRRTIFVGCCSFFWTTVLAAWKSSKEGVHINFRS